MRDEGFQHLHGDGRYKSEFDHLVQHLAGDWRSADEQFKAQRAQLKGSGRRLARETVRVAWYGLCFLAGLFLVSLVLR